MLNLIGFIQDTKTKFSPFATESYDVIEDGDRYTSFGNAAGGTWEGDYRYFVLEDSEGNNQIVSISVLGSMKCVNHPVFGNRKGQTILVVAIDDFDKRHNSLQLNLDKYVHKQGNEFVVWHDGTITIGKKGAAKRSEMIEYIRKNDSTLLNQNDIIVLGTFDCTREILWKQPEAKAFIRNLIQYALIRDDFRRAKSE